MVSSKTKGGGVTYLRFWAEHERSQRVALQQRISQLADDWLYASDPAIQPATDRERIACLGQTFAVLRHAVRAGKEPAEALLALAAETQLWLEAREREAAR